ncbi:hypothetical protein AB0A71_38350, partial [Kitasatospora aureofaciens]
MSIIRRFRKSGPSLRPELDDVKLGNVRRQLSSRAVPGHDGIRIDQIERLLHEAGTDWDRRTHRLALLA